MVRRSRVDAPPGDIFAIAVAAVAALAAMVRAEPRLTREVATGLVAAIVVVNALGFLLLLADYAAGCSRLARFHYTGALLVVPSTATRLPIGDGDYAAVLVQPYASEVGASLGPP